MIRAGRYREISGKCPAEYLMPRKHISRRRALGRSVASRVALAGGLHLAAFAICAVVNLSDAMQWPIIAQAGRRT